MSESGKNCFSEAAGKMSGCAGCPNQTLCLSGQVKQTDPGLSPFNFVQWSNCFG